MTSQIVNKVDAGWFIRCRRSRIPLLDGNAGHTPSNRLTIIVRNISWFARRIAQRKPVLWPRSCPQRHRPMGRRLQQFPATLVAGISPPAVYAGSIAATGAPTLRNMKTRCLRRLLPLHQLVYSKLPRLQSPLDESSVAGQRINTMHWSLGFDGKLLEQFESMDSIKGHRGLDKNPYMPESLLRSVPTSVDHSYCRYISCIGNFQRS